MRNHAQPAALNHPQSALLTPQAAPLTAQAAAAAMLCFGPFLTQIFGRIYASWLDQLRKALSEE